MAWSASDQAKGSAGTAMKQGLAWDMFGTSHGIAGTSVPCY